MMGISPAVGMTSASDGKHDDGKPAAQDRYRQTTVVGTSLTADSACTMRTGTREDAMSAVEVRDSDLAGMIKLLQEQEQHFGELSRYASSRCGDTSGLTQLMGLVAPKVEDLADWSSWKLNRCRDRMSGTGQDLSKVRQLYADADTGHVERLQQLFGEPMGNVTFETLRYEGIASEVRFAELTETGAAVFHASYKDRWDPPAAPSGESPGLNDLIDQRKNTLVANCEDIWQFATDLPPLAQLLITPISGDYSKLYWLYEAYLNLGNSTYAIAENIRRGHLTIGPRWNGAASNYFEYHVFMWGQGVGGLGDLFQIASLVFRWIYRKSMEVAQEILERVVDLIYKHFGPLNGILDRNPAFRSFVEANCGVPGRPIKLIPDGMLSEADLAQWNKRIGETAEFVQQIERKVEEYRQWFETAKQEISKIWEDIDVAREDPGAYVIDTIHEKAQDRVVNFERPSGEFNENQWEPRAGVWRVTLVPS
jgi:uncharacterized protein YukE